MASAPAANLNFHVRYRLGIGRRADAPREARSIGITRPLIVSDPGVAAQPWFAALADSLPGATVFTDVRSNPVPANVDGGLAAYRAGGCDGIVLVGGGSVMDAGKAVALRAGHDAPLFDYEFLVGTRWKEIRRDRLPPMLAIPTTAGSGSELSPGLVITDPGAGVKRTLLSPFLVPTAVLADPEVTFGVPPRVTAATGMDAFTHCFEAWCAPGYNPIADGIALEGLRLVAENLPAAVRRPDDAAARSHMMMAASQAAVAFQKGLGLVHAMAHPLGAVTDIHHGLANAILLPYVVGFNRAAIGERMERLVRYLGLGAGGDPVDAVIAWIVALRNDIGIPHRLDVAPGLAAELAPRAAAEKAYVGSNPRPASEAEIRGVYERAIEGAL
ncbi:MAG TPA: iron-containing alcohol dehydrogenase [Kofleriaceae bacterium]|nr:iron-containing alcohol dehydrogenase [Kofleriaceae bacterium]